MNKRIKLFVMGGLLMLGLFGCGETPDVKDKQLISYSFFSGGGMTGGGSSTSIALIDGEVILTDSRTGWWYEDAAITEYKLDQAVLAEIEHVFRKYHMQRWHQKKFSDLFVADGESYSYSFTFDDGTNVFFSSQVYPAFYSRKLSEIREVIETYKASGALEPGLVPRERTPEEAAAIDHPDNGRVEIEVYQYSKDGVYYRILNGTNEDVTISRAVRLVRNGDGAVLCSESGASPTTVRAASAESEYLTTGRLEEGSYTLSVGDHSAGFEIRLPGNHESVSP